MVTEPDSTAVRVALWRAMHMLVDPVPHVLEDEVGLHLAAPDGDWRARPDMDPAWTGPFRAGTVARARFVEDLLADRIADGTRQYVLLGAGLDTLAQRRPDLGPSLRVFEIDQPGPQAWKRERLEALGYGEPDWLHFVPVDFEAGASWWGELVAAGFDARRPALVASTGVSMYLTRQTTAEMLDQVAQLPAGSTLAMTFLLPTALLDEADRPAFEAAQEGAPVGHTVRQSLHARRCRRAGAGRGLRTRGARLGAHACRALLRGPLRRSTPVERRGLPRPTT